MEHMQGLMPRERSDDFADRIEAPLGGARLGPVGGRGARRSHPSSATSACGRRTTSQPGMVEVGWRLAAAHWGHGYATEAAREGLRFGFVEVGLPEIVSFTVPQNERSWRVMERIGLVRIRRGTSTIPASTRPPIRSSCGTCCTGWIGTGGDGSRRQRRDGQDYDEHASTLASVFPK